MPSCYQCLSYNAAKEGTAAWGWDRPTGHASSTYVSSAGICKIADHKPYTEMDIVQSVARESRASHDVMSGGPHHHTLDTQS